MSADHMNHDAANIGKTGDLTHLRDLPGLQRLPDDYSGRTAEDVLAPSMLGDQRLVESMNQFMQSLHETFESGEM
jgi:hypothetical protein